MPGAPPPVGRGNTVGIIALDLSKRSTGWAVWMPEMTKPIWGTWVLGSEFTSDGRTYAKLLENLSDQRKLTRFEAAFYEQPLRAEVLQGFTNIDTLRILSGLAAQTEYFSYAVGLRCCQAVPLGSWRKHFIGKMPRGTKTKEWKDYAKERCAQYGWTVRTDDEADALGLLDYGCEVRGIIPPWRANEVLRPILGGAK